MKKFFRWFRNTMAHESYSFEDYIQKSKELESQLKRYQETYKLLGEYDKKHIEDPEVLADAGRLRAYTSRLQRYSNN